MNWLVYATLGAILNAFSSLCIKLSSGRIHPGLGGSILNFVALVITGAYAATMRSRGSIIQYTSPGIFYSVLAGLLIGTAVTCFYTMLGSGTNVSLGVPVVQIGNILLASTLGILLLKESFTPKYLVGMVLALAGLYLVITSKA